MLLLLLPNYSIVGVGVEAGSNGYIFPATADGAIIPYRNVPANGAITAEMTVTDRTDAWSNYRETQWRFDQLTATAPSTNAVVAENAADDAEEARKAAETAAGEAEEHARFVKTRAMFAQEKAVEVTKIAVTATAAALVKAQADYDEDDSLTNFRDLEDAKDAAEEAGTAAEDAAKAVADAAPGEDDDTVAGDDDDTVAGDDDGDMMAMVTANGVGNLLKFGYWTTDGKDTLLAVTNLGKAQETVNVKIVDDMGMVASTMTVCLGAGDTWTAAMTASADGMGSTVGGGNPGSCSGVMGSTSFSATSGLIEVYPADMDMDMNGYLMGTATLVNTDSWPRFELQRDLARG